MNVSQADTTAIFSIRQIRLLCNEQDIIVGRVREIQGPVILIIHRMSAERTLESLC